MKNRFQYFLTTLTCIFLLGTALLFAFRTNHKDPVSVNRLSADTNIIQNDESTDFSPQLVNINTAGIEELTTLPEIGPVLAQRIIDNRNENGIYHSIGELSNVPGIGSKRLELIWDYITIE